MANQPTSSRGWRERPPMTTTPPLLTVAEVAEIYRVDPETVRRWLKAGRLNYVRLPGGGYRIPADTELRSL